MKTVRVMAALLLLAALASRAAAQDKPDKPKAPDLAAVELLKVTVVFSEYDGDKKISSLPYTLFLKAQEHRPFYGKVRMGVRVPISTGAKDAQLQYQDIGSNIDCSAEPAGDGRYILDLVVERSSLYSGSNSKDDQLVDWAQGLVHEPSIRDFRANYALILRDGQTTQSTMATDPLNGHTMRVDTTLSVLK